MCLDCGFYNGRQVMDLVAEKAARDARMKAKKDRIKADVGTPSPDLEETKEEVSTEDSSKEANEENDTDNRPEKKVE